MIQSPFIDILPVNGVPPLHGPIKLDGDKAANFDAMLTDARAEKSGGDTLPSVISDVPSEPAENDASGLAAFLADLGQKSRAKTVQPNQTAVPLADVETALNSPTADDPLAAQDLPLATVTGTASDLPEVGEFPLPDAKLVASETTPAPGVDDQAAAGSDPALQGPKPADAALAVHLAGTLQTKPTIPAERPASAAIETMENSSEPKAAATPIDARGSQAVHTPVPKSMPSEMVKETTQPPVTVPNGADPEAPTQLAPADKPVVAAQVGPMALAAESARDAASQQLPQPMPAGRPEWPETFVRSVQMMPVQDGETLTIALTPERLGAVQVRMEMVDGVATVNIVTETPEAAKLFVEHQQRLAETFARNGIEMSSQSVSTSSDGGNARRDTGQGAQPHDFSEDAPRAGAEDNLNDSVLADMVRRRGLVDLTA